MTNEEILVERNKVIAERRKYAQAIRVLGSETFPDCKAKDNLRMFYERMIAQFDSNLHDLALAMEENNRPPEEKKYTETDLQKAIQTAIDDYNKKKVEAEEQQLENIQQALKNLFRF